jgi:hypothetical protein
MMGNAATGGSAVIKATTAVVPETFNVLLNPLHAHAGQVESAQVSEQAIDPRLFK